MLRGGPIPLFTNRPIPPIFKNCKLDFLNALFFRIPRHYRPFLPRKSILKKKTIVIEYQPALNCNTPTSRLSESDIVRIKNDLIRKSRSVRTFVFSSVVLICTIIRFSPSKICSLTIIWLLFRINNSKFQLD